MVDDRNLNPEPAPNPASVDKANKPLPAAPPVDVAAEQAGAQAQSLAAGSAAGGTAWPGAFAAFGEAFNRIKANPEPAFLYVGVYFLLSIVSQATSHDKHAGLGVNMVAAGLVGLASLVFLLAMPTYALALSDGRKITIGQFMKFDFNRWINLFLLGIILTIIFVFSLVLFIVPLIWTMAWYYASDLIVVDKGLGAIEAMKESKRISANHKAKLWGFFGACALIAFAFGIIGAIPYVGGLFQGFFAVWSAAAGAMLYRWLAQNAANTGVK